MASAIEIFFCYAREDEPLRIGLEKQLKVLRRQGLLNVWHDRQISPGTEWEREIDTHLNTAHIILLLVSPDFMDSDYCYGIEMKKAMERHERGEARVIPVILRPVYWQRAPFGKPQVLPTDAKPVTSSGWHSLDEAFFDVAEGIRQAVETFLFRQAKAQADTHISQGEYKEALAAYEQALHFDPTDADAYNSKGFTLFELQRYEEALIAFEQAIRLDPHSAHAFNNKGSVLGNLKRYHEALAAFEQAALLDPSNAQIYMNKGRALDELKRYREALVSFEQATLLDSDLSIPKTQYIKWAKELLSMPNLAFFELDTTGLYQDDEIIRILLINRKGETIFDTFLCPDKPLSAQISYITSISDHDLEIAPTITEAWGEITQALTGKYLLSFNLAFDLRKLEEAAERYKLDMPPITGDCLMEKAIRYSGSFSYAKLSTLCSYIGYPLSDHPYQTALDRARGQITLLEAISQGLLIEKTEDVNESHLLQEKEYIPFEEKSDARFGKFTKQALRVLSLAQEEAQNFQHNYIGTEHLLLGLVRVDEGVSTKVLRNLGVELNKVRSGVEYIIGRGGQIVLGEIGLTPRAKKVIELAVDEARRLNHQYLGTGHLLLGLIREGEGIVVGVLENLGVNLENIRTQIMNLIAQQ